MSLEADRWKKNADYARRPRWLNGLDGKLEVGFGVIYGLVALAVCAWFGFLVVALVWSLLF